MLVFGFTDTDKKTMMISEVDSGRRNNMDAMRFVAATAVIWAHAYNLRNFDDPLKEVTGFSTGMMSVGVFFALSGFLIARSLTTRPSLLEFVVARALRILPALLVANVLVVLVAGLFWTSLGRGEFFGSGDPWMYIVRNTTLIKAKYPLPGVFTSNPHSDTVNGSLWTLPVEARMYGLVFLAGVCAFALKGLPGTLAERRRRMVGWFGLAGLLLSFGGWTLLGLPGTPVLLGSAGFQLLGFFSMGIIAHSLRRWVRLDGRIVIAGLVACVLLSNTVIHDGLVTVWLSYACLWIAYTPIINARSFGARGDFSYGIYIFAFPVQQWLYWMDPMMAPLVNTLVTFCIVIVLAVLSFWFIEKPAMRSRKIVTTKIQGILDRMRKDRPLSRKAGAQ